MASVILLLALAGPAQAEEPAAQPSTKADSAIAESAGKPSGEGAAPSAELLRDLAPVKEQAAVLQAGVFSLRQALAEAYLKNPELEAARAELRAVDETYAQAISGYRPSVDADASYSSVNIEDDTSETRGDPKSLSIGITQPIYRGGSTTAEVTKSENTIKAQRASLHAKEQQVLLDTAAAYMDVLRDQETLNLNLNNEKVLRNHLEASQERFNLGDITKTDVSQAESRLADAVANKVAAEGNLKKSRATLEKMVGLRQDRLEKPATLTNLPQSMEDALQAAENENPALTLARHTSAAAEASTRSVIGQLLPQIDLSGELGKTYDTTGGDDEENSRSVTLRATIPFYSGGDTYSRIRQSRQVETQRRLEIQKTERDVRKDVIDAWEALAAARAEKDARNAQIKASKLALDGVRVESEYGSRTTLDLLDAEQEYLDAQVALVSAERDETVAGYQLLATVGRLTAAGLGLDTPGYSPEKNFQNVKWKWFGGEIQEDSGG